MGSHGCRHQSGSSFILGDPVELRSLFLGGRTGEDVQLSESDDSPESGLDLFPPLSVEDRSSVSVGMGDVEALENSGLAQVSGRGTPNRDDAHSRSAYLRFRFWYFCSSCSRSALMLKICPRATFATP